MGDCGRTARLNDGRPQCVLPSHRLTVCPQANHKASDGPASCSSSSASFSTSTPMTCWVSGVLQPSGRHLMRGCPPPALRKREGHRAFSGMLTRTAFRGNAEAKDTGTVQEESHERNSALSCSGSLERHWGRGGGVVVFFSSLIPRCFNPKVFPCGEFLFFLQISIGYSLMREKNKPRTRKPRNSQIHFAEKFQTQEKGAAIYFFLKRYRNIFNLFRFRGTERFSVKLSSVF